MVALVPAIDGLACQCAVLAVVFVVAVFFITVFVGVDNFDEDVLVDRDTAVVVVADIFAFVVVVVYPYLFCFFFPLRFSPRYLQLRSYFGWLPWDQWHLFAAGGMCSIPLLCQGVCWDTFTNLPRDSAYFEL